MTALTVYGPFLTQTGHGHHTREFVRELTRQGIAVELKNVPLWSPAVLPSEQRNYWFETLASPVGANIVLHFCMPHQVKPDPDKLNVNFTMFEASRVHAEWVRLGRAHDLLIVPAESSRRAWEETGMPANRIRICPLGVDPSAFAPFPDGTAPGKPRVRFLNVSEHNSRKNLAGLLRAWTKATRLTDDAILTIKTSKTLQPATLPVELDGAAPVRILRATLPDSEMPALYRAATHYISASFGEGWDQPMMEAAATGLKLIAPDHSAYREYLDDTVATMIPARVVPAVFDSDAATAKLFENAQWWEPDEDALVESIRAAIQGGEPAKLPVRDRIVNRFSWEDATRHLVEILRELEPLAKHKRSVVALLRNRRLSPAAERSRSAARPDRDSS
jgi:glycosyltransferase involved in cell wall biosynthesis